ncbi:MAG: diguanylate cyclase [Armatimonadota bacterium]
MFSGVRSDTLLSQRSSLVLALTATAVIVANLLLVRDAADRTDEQRTSGVETRLSATLESLDAALREREAVGAAYVATGTERFRLRADRLGALVKDRLADISSSSISEPARPVVQGATISLERTDRVIALRNAGGRDAALARLEREASADSPWEAALASLRNEQRKRVIRAEFQALADLRAAERHALLWSLGTLGLLTGGFLLARRENQRLAAMAEEDPLTRLKNRRAFEDRVVQAFQLARRHGHALSVLMIDVDFFKNYNDDFGHVAGDAALIRVSEILKRTARTSDVVSRYGGEEFVVLLPHTDGRQALQAAERMRAALADDPTPHRALTISIGIGFLKEGMETAEDLVKSADRALYQAKYAGRDITAFDD